MHQRVFRGASVEISGDLIHSAPWRLPPPRGAVIRANQDTYVFINYTLCVHMHGHAYWVAGFFLVRLQS